MGGVAYVGNKSPPTKIKKGVRNKGLMAMSKEVNKSKGIGQSNKQIFGGSPSFYLFLTWKSLISGTWG